MDIFEPLSDKSDGVKNNTLLFATIAQSSYKFKPSRPTRLRAQARPSKLAQIVRGFADPDGLSPRVSVAQIVEEGLKVHRLGASVAERRRLIETALEEVGLDPKAAERYPHEFCDLSASASSFARARGQPVLARPDAPHRSPPGPVIPEPKQGSKIVFVVVDRTSRADQISRPRF